MSTEENKTKRAYSSFGANASHSMFFIRHTAHPKHLKFLKCADGNMIYSMKESEEDVNSNRKDDYQFRGLNFIYDPKYSLNFQTNIKNKQLLEKYKHLLHPNSRKETILPPLKQFTCVYMLSTSYYFSI